MTTHRHQNHTCYNQFRSHSDVSELRAEIESFNGPVVDFAELGGSIYVRTTSQKQALDIQLDLLRSRAFKAPGSRGLIHDRVVTEAEFTGSPFDRRRDESYYFCLEIV